MIQLELNLKYLETLKKAYLLAPGSAKQAFYKIWLKTDSNNYKVLKESGARALVLDRRTWEFDSLEAAENFFNRQIRYKTNPFRKSPRKYQVVG